MGWDETAAALADELEAAGYDVDRSAAHLDQGGSLTARLDQGRRSVVLSVDAGLRVRATVTTLLGEEMLPPLAIGAAPLQIVERLTSAVTATGRLTTEADLGPLLAALARAATLTGHRGSETAGLELRSTPSPEGPP